MPWNNEAMGIAAEVAIAKSFGIAVSPYYEARAEQTIVDLLLKKDSIRKIFEKENIPAPIQHIAEKHNPVDFLLMGNKTLSVKTNQGELGKVAPQRIGQPTAETYFNYLVSHVEGFCLKDELAEEGRADNYEGRAHIFKKYTLEHPAEVVDMYWRNLFDCDYYIHLYNLAYRLNPLGNYIVLDKAAPPVWDATKFSFTQERVIYWNESNTLKYCGISVGEFQVHRNRNCFKFRFNMKGVMELFVRGYI